MKSYFYNTIGLNGSQLADAKRSCQNQEAVILRFINANTGSWSAWDLHETPNFYHIPITSIRRALHNLLDRAEIKEVGMTIGPYGKPVTKYTSNIYYQASLF